jgi:hypothetical protein
MFKLPFMLQRPVLYDSVNIQISNAFKVQRKFCSLTSQSIVSFRFTCCLCSCALLGTLCVTQRFNVSYFQLLYPCCA